MYKVDRKHVNLTDPLYVQNLKSENDNAAAGWSGTSGGVARLIPELREELEEAAASLNDDLQKARAILERATAEANSIISEAVIEATRIIESSRESAEEELEAARKDGFEQGSREGRRICEEKLAQQRLDDKAMLEARICEDNEALRRVIDQLNNESALAYEELEKDTVDLALDIVKKVFGPDKTAGVDLYESLIKNALRQIKPSGKVIIRVSTAEYERFFPTGSAVFDMDNGVKVTAAIMRDMSLARGDLIVDSEDETVNAGIETQINKIQFTFNRARYGEN